MLKTRALTALLFAPALLGIIYWGGLALQVACFVLAMLMVWEFLRMSIGAGQHYIKTVGYGLGGWTAAAALGWIPISLAATVTPLLVVGVFGAVLVRPHPINQAVGRIGILLFGAAYGAGLIPYLARLRDLPEGLGLASMALFCTWGADTGAYFAGRALGKHKLYASISPAKTVEGAVGGVLASVAVAFFMRWLFDMPLDVGLTVLIGVVAGFFDVVGDLCESLLKRSAGVKDSSGLIPGHGGVLDRFDGVMFVAPAIFVVVLLLG